MRKIIMPKNMPRPASAYHHGLLVASEAQVLYLSGQLGERPDGSISREFEDQVKQSWTNIKTLLAEADMTIRNITKVTSYLVGRNHVPAYVAVHRSEVGEFLPPWTLLLVEGLGSPDYLVEIDIIASK